MKKFFSVIAIVASVVILVAAFMTFGPGCAYPPPPPPGPGPRHYEPGLFGPHPQGPPPPR